MLTDQFELLARYLPRDVNMGQNLDYVNYHSRAIHVNGENDLYTLEYFAFHILWMSFLEKITHLLYMYDESGVKTALGNDGSANRVLSDSISLYDLSAINEKKLCEITKYPLIGYHGNQIGNLRELVDKRDHIAHCSGVLDLHEEDILQYARRCVRYTMEINDRINVVILARWDSFIIFLNGNNQQYSLVHDAVIEYLSRDAVSLVDIETILKMRTISDSALEESNFRGNLALMQLAFVAEDYDIDLDISENYKATILSHTITEEQKAQVQDENEAYVRFRVRLVK